MSDQQGLVVVEAPSIFQLSDHPFPYSHDISIAVEICPICRSGKNHLYCPSCVRTKEIRGNSGSITDGLKRLQELAEIRETLSEKIEKLIKKEYLKDDKRIKIMEMEERVRIFRLQFDQKVEERNAKKQRLLDRRSVHISTTRKIASLKSKIPVYRKKVGALTEEVTVKKPDKLEQLRARLQCRRQRSIMEHEESIFQVEFIADKKGVKEKTAGADAISREIADAVGQTYDGRRWEYVETDLSQCYRIIGMRLAPTGDIKALAQYCMKETTDRGTLKTAREAFEQFAAIGYISQFIHVMADILCRPLPYATYIPRLDMDTMKPEDVENFVAQLNYNILFLCASQGMPIDDLNPVTTIANLFHFVHNKHIGRSDPFTMTSSSHVRSLCERVTHPCVNEALVDDSFEEINPTEKEMLAMTSLPLASLMNSPSGLTVTSSNTDTTTDGGLTTSYAGMVNSVTSVVSSVLSSWWPSTR